jgi:hypothetical protein
MPRLAFTTDLPAPTPTTTRAAAGRPSVLATCGLGEHDLLAIKRHALTATRWEDVVSCSLAVRRFAASLPADHAFRLWCEARHSKHHLPPSLMEALGFARVNGGRGGRLVAHDQDPKGRERLRYEPTAPGSLRPAEAGMQVSFDDGSMNFVVWTEIDGVVRCGRFQLILCVDQATDYILGFAFVARERDAYRAEDLSGLALWPTFAALGAPEQVIHEGGVSNASRMHEFYQAIGVEPIRSYHPRTKRVEAIFNQLWTWLGDLPASVGRTRGENKHGTELLMRARAGRCDPREVFLSMAEATRRVTEACFSLNRERRESRTYGRWVPEERWAAESPRHLHALDAGLAWVARDERRTLTVRRDGTVRPRLTDAWGQAHEFAFGWGEGWRHAGTEVVCTFSSDPARAAAEGCRITTADGKTLLAERADALCDALAATTLRKAQSESVRSEHRALRPGGVLAAWATETRGPEGTVRTEVRSGAGATAARAAEPETRARSAASADPTRRRSLSEADIDAAFADAALGL